MNNFLAKNRRESNKPQNKVAVVLFNLGAPDQIKSVRPFLRNLFLDPAIIRLPFLLRFPLALLISRLRAQQAVKIYKALGGGSPLLANTKKQAAALEQNLQKIRSEEVKVFIAMRYWHPMSDETVGEVKDWCPSQVILVPLYPQFSSSTTASSLKLWTDCARARNFNCKTKVLCCYPDASGFVEAVSENVRELLQQEKSFDGLKPLRILFSAHGIPQKFVKQGDPYQYQIEKTVAAIVNNLKLPTSNDWKLCYQSRVGPMKWLQPYTKDEIRRAGSERRPLLIVPIAFVSEHSETLYELDKEYFKIAIESGVPIYLRAATVGVASSFITSLSSAISSRIDNQVSAQVSASVSSYEDKRICPRDFNNCPHSIAQKVA